MSESSAKRLLRYLLIPVAKYCLRHALQIQDMLEVAKAVFVEEACRQVEQTGEKVNTSRLSVITGLHRRDVERIYKRKEIQETPQGLLNKIIGQWQYDPRFSSQTHKPKLLSCKGEESEFHSLAASVSRDINPGTVLFELERRDLISRKGDKVKLNEMVLQVAKKRDGQSWEDGFKILSLDLTDQIEAVQENLSIPRVHNLHGRTEFDRIPLEHELEIRSWLLKQGSQFHTDVRDYLAKFDSDLSPEEHEPESSENSNKKNSAKSSYLRVSVGAYSFISRRSSNTES